MTNSLVPRRENALGRPGAFGGGSLFDLHRQVNRLFDNLLDDRPFGSLSQPAGFAGSNWPQLDIQQDDRTIRIEADLPGVKEDDIDLTVEDGVLTLAGEKRSERKDENGYSERSYGRFERRITLPANIDDDACSAQFKDGVLTVTIPRSAEKQRGRRIPLGGASGGQPAGQSPGQSEGQADNQAPGAAAAGQQQAPAGGNDNAALSGQQVAQERAGGGQQS
jgi:HSP20 family protein